MKKKKKRQPAYQLTCTENQLRVIHDALEWFFRLQMGQFMDFSNEVARNGYVYDREDPRNDEKFDAYIKRRNDCKAMFEAGYRIANPFPCEQTPDMLTAQDIWAVIRHFRWEEKPEPKSHVTTEAQKPLILTMETPVKIVKNEDDEDE